jgi:hypothetical protein
VLEGKERKRKTEGKRPKSSCDHGKGKERRKV